jgi:hypothetical protein
MPTVTTRVCGAMPAPRTTACGDDVTIRVGTSSRARGSSAAMTACASFS